MLDCRFNSWLQNLFDSALWKERTALYKEPKISDSTALKNGDAPNTVI
jgi:hypothetical protein